MALDDHDGALHLGGIPLPFLCTVIGHDFQVGGVGDGVGIHITVEYAHRSNDLRAAAVGTVLLQRTADTLERSTGAFFLPQVLYQPVQCRSVSGLIAIEEQKVKAAFCLLFDDQGHPMISDIQDRQGWFSARGQLVQGAV